VNEEAVFCVVGKIRGSVRRFCEVVVEVQIKQDVLEKRKRETKGATEGINDLLSFYVERRKKKEEEKSGPDMYVGTNPNWAMAKRERLAVLWANLGEGDTVFSTKQQDLICFLPRRICHRWPLFELCEQSARDLLIKGQPVAMVPTSSAISILGKESWQRICSGRTHPRAAPTQVPTGAQSLHWLLNSNLRLQRPQQGQQ
jgi:hypothetical protein